MEKQECRRCEPVVIYVPEESFNHETDSDSKNSSETVLVNALLGQIEEERGIFYGIAGHPYLLDLALNATRHYERVILAHPKLSYEYEGKGAERRKIEKDLTGTLARSLNERTRVVYFSDNGQGQEFLGKLIPEQRERVRVIRKTSDSITSEGLKKILFRD
jgi:hypothetical protein